MDDNIKWSITERRHLYDISHINPGPALDKRRVQDERNGSLVIGEQGKIHYSSRHDKEKDFKPCLKQIEYLEHSGYQVNRGVKLFPSKSTNNTVLDPASKFINPVNAAAAVKEQTLLKMFPESASRVADDITMPPGFYTKIRVYRPSGERAANVLSDEYNLEPVMNRKSRVPDLVARRGLVPVAHLGDKAYKSPEQSTAFFNQGGLIPGSTITYHPSKSKSKSCNSSGSETQPATTTRLDGIEKYNEKKKSKERSYDLDQVKSLTESATVLEQKIPSWEQRAGLPSLDDDSDKE